MPEGHHWLVEAEVTDRCQLLPHVSLSDTALPLPIVALEKVRDLLSGHREILTVAGFEKCKVVMKRAKAFRVSVDGTVEVCEVDLGDLVLPL